MAFGPQRGPSGTSLVAQNKPAAKQAQEERGGQANAEWTCQRPGKGGPGTGRESSPGSHSGHSAVLSHVPAPRCACGQKSLEQLLS